MLDNFLSTVHQNFKAAAVKFSLQKLTNAAAAARWRQCRSLGAALQLFSRLDIVRKTCYVVQRAHIKCAGFFLRDFLLHVQFLYHACVRVLVHCASWSVHIYSQYGALSPGPKLYIPSTINIITMYSGNINLLSKYAVLANLQYFKAKN